MPTNKKETFNIGLFFICRSSSNSFIIAILNFFELYRQIILAITRIFLYYFVRKQYERCDYNGTVNFI